MSTAGKSILMVDDDQEIRELLQTYLSRSGFQVHAEADGAGFRRSLESIPCQNRSMNRRRTAPARQQ